MQTCADKRIRDACRTFNDIMTGPNPLTPDEIRRLIDKKGGLWCLFEKWATPSSERRA